MGTLVLVSWNVLADSYIRRSFYPNVDPALLAPGVRTDAVVAELEHAGCDVACLQEVEPAVVNALREAGWWVHYALQRAKPDGCAIISRGVPIDSVRVICFSDGAPDREDSGHVAVLATVGDLGIATTHLRWDRPGTPAEERWAMRQSHELLAAIGDGGPWVACGDLNVEPGDEAYALWLAEGFVDPAADAPAPTANPRGRAKRIDHILLRGATASVLPVFPVENATPLPSPAMPSDHVPIGVKLAW